MWQSHNGPVPSPFRKDQLSPEMQARYGMDHRSWGTWILAGVLIVAFAAAFVFVSANVTAAPIEVDTIGWDESAPDHVDVDFAVTRPGGREVECAIRAQDATHIDVGYAVMTIPAGPERVHETYPLAIIAKSANAEVLGCATPGELHVTGPQFPPGVVPPAQPYTP